ncbi:MAG TPA: DUF5715 family protein [Longimicrobiaceae bacterium]|nr:DUF5715 family protein [Longimicrobiaceae bacterium]
MARIWPRAKPFRESDLHEVAMHGTRRWTGALLLALLASGGCRPDEHRGYDDPVEEPRPRVPLATARPVTAADSARARAGLAAESVAVQSAFGKATPLRAREVGELRQDKNAKQVATAQRLGLRVSDQAEIERLVRAGRLVALGDSTEHWILRGMPHSVPYVTPDTRAMLVELGRRFHARLDRLGLPRYRMKVTSALRTDETQAELRKTNSYASRTASAHEFGTTVDVSHERFAAPAPDAARVGWEMEAEMLDGVGKEHAKVLQAELGRAIAELRSRGVLHVMMENKQPVYHMTVARRFPGSPASR